MTSLEVISNHGMIFRPTEIFEQFCWEPIENTLKKREIIMTFKTIQDELPGYMSQLLKFNHNDMCYLSSNDSKMKLLKPSIFNL